MENLWQKKTKQTERLPAISLCEDFHNEGRQNLIGVPQLLVPALQIWGCKKAEELSKELVS